LHSKNICNWSAVINKWLFEEFTFEYFSERTWTNVLNGFKMSTAWKLRIILSWNIV
jgi:hypothetical protein